MAKKPTLDELSLEELKSLSREIEKAIRTSAARNLKRARDAAEAAARQFGLSLEDLVERRPGVKTKLSDAKYRNPDDPTQTWSGRVRQPQWFKDAIAAGRVPQDLAA